MELNKIYNEDCREILPLLPDKSIDLVLTDPPYGITKSDWDKVPDKYIFDELFRVSKEQLFFGGQFFDLPRKEGWIVWSKKQDWMTKPFSQSQVNEAELIWISKPIKTKVIEYHVWGNVEGFKGEKLKPDYKRPKNIFTSQKPIRLISYIIETFFSDCDIILDPFLGSGTTAVACINTNRHFIGCELDKGYYDIAVKRVEEARHKVKLL